MSRASVKEILQDIDALGDTDRAKLERELARRFEREWRTEVGSARKTARSRSIDQSAIDRVIEHRRYGK